MRARGESTVLASVFNDVASQHRTQSADVGEEVFRCRVEVHTYRIYAQLYGLVERVSQARLVNIVLILTYANALRVNLYQLGHGVHQSARNRYGAAHGDVLFRKLLACHLRSRIDTGAVLAHYVHGDTLNLSQNIACFARGGTVSAGNGLYVVALGDGGKAVERRRLPCALTVGLMACGKNYVVVEERSLRIEHDNLAACAYAWVDTHDTFWAKRCGKQELSEVLLEHFDSLCVRFLFALSGKFVFDRRAKQTFVRIIDGLANQFLARPIAAHVLALQTFDAGFVVNGDAHS